jgi:hypothetical protein
LVVVFSWVFWGFNLQSSSSSSSSSHQPAFKLLVLCVHMN